MRTVRQALRQLAGCEEADECSGEGLRVARLDQEAVPTVLDEVRDAADAARDDGARAAEGLDDHAAHPFGAGRQHEERRLVQGTRDLLLGEPLVPARLSGNIAEKLLDDRPQRPGAD